MDVKVCLFLFVLCFGWCCSARELVSDNQQVGKEVEALEVISANQQVCSLCEEFTSEAIKYLAQNKTQQEIIEILHKSCSKLSTFKKQCITLVDYYGPLFFIEISTIQPAEFCQKVDLCEKVVSISQQLSKDSCELCHRAMTEALLKLKDPDTQLEIIELLLKACDSAKGYDKKCKKLVFEYAPIILVNAEQFLETNDVCTMLHACDVPTSDAAKVLPAAVEESMHSAF